MDHQKINLDLSILIPHINGIVLSSADMVYLGLQALEESNLQDLKEPDVGVQVLWTEGHIHNISDLKEKFKSWIIGNALVRSLESLNPIFNEVRKVCEIARNCVNGQIKGEMLEPLSRYEFPKVDDTKGFERGNITRRLNILKDYYKFPLQSDMYNALISLDHCRNCLVHRSGVVRLKEDINGNGHKDAMAIKWLKPAYRVKDLKGKERFVTIGDIVQGGETLYKKIEFQETIKKFKETERIVLSVDEFGEISIMLIYFGGLLVNTIVEYCKQHGIKPQESI